MFNEALKESFLDYYAASEANRRSIASVFNAFAPYEESLGKDICTMSAKELQSFFDKNSMMRLQSARSRMTVLRRYTDWCIRNGVPGASDAPYEVNIGDATNEADSMRKISVASPKQLMLHLNKVFEPERMETLDNALRCACWLAYGGVLWHSVQNVTANEVDLDNFEVVHDGEPCVLYREAVPSVKNCLTLTQFRYLHDNYRPDIVCYRDRTDGNQLIRGFKRPFAYQTVVDRISKKTVAAKKSDSSVKSMSLKNIWLCGMFYRTYELEIEGVEPSFVGVARFLYEKDYLKGGERCRLPQEKEHIFIRDKAKHMLNDYCRWKETF